MRELNPSITGQITELKCQLYLIEQGFNVLIPMGNYQKYDLVIEYNGKFIKIQIKHATGQDNGQSFVVKTKYNIRDTSKNQRVKTQKYTKQDCDYFMTEFDNQFYIFPNFDTLSTKFWLKETCSKNQKRAQDYLAKNLLQQL